MTSQTTDGPHNSGKQLNAPEIEEPSTWDGLVNWLGFSTPHTHIAFKTHSPTFKPQFS